MDGGDHGWAEGSAELSQASSGKEFPRPIPAAVQAIVRRTKNSGSLANDLTLWEIGLKKASRVG